MAKHADTTPVSYEEILEAEIVQGLHELRREPGGLLLSGLSAGLDVGFSLLLMAVMYTAVHDQFSTGLTRILMANMYAIGFIFVILGRSELFTEHTTLAVFPVLGGRARVGSVARLWGLVYVSNVVGAAFFAALAAWIAPALGIADSMAFTTIAEHLVEHDWWIIFVSAGLAGWLMGLLSWLVNAARDTISRIVIVWLVTAGIGFARLHHSIVGTVEVLAGVFGGVGIGFSDFVQFLLWSTIGNAVGGLFFVAVIKYSHAIRRRENNRA